MFWNVCIFSNHSPQTCEPPSWKNCCESDSMNDPANYFKDRVLLWRWCRCLLGLYAKYKHLIGFPGRHIFRAWNNMSPFKANELAHRSLWSKVLARDILSMTDTELPIFWRYRPSFELERPVSHNPDLLVTKRRKIDGRRAESTLNELTVKTSSKGFNTREWGGLRGRKAIERSGLISTHIRRKFYSCELAKYE